MPAKFQGLGTGQYKLVICEKPLAAKRISEVLGSKKMIKRELAPGAVVFEIITNEEQRFIVCSALGHLYSLFPTENNRKKYPIYEVIWSPRDSAIGREKRRIMQTLKVIEYISKGASGFIHACDYDLEGELIGYNILQYACNNKYDVSKRAKFSSLAYSEINQSFNNLVEPNIRTADAGKARHLIDFIFGINLSRALSHCLNASNLSYQYRNLTIGRVQGPTLGFIVNREKKIRNHIPDPVWHVIGKFEKCGSVFEANLISAVHKSSDVKKILRTCQSESGVINKIVHHHESINPPTPFNISNLQKEAYRIFKMSPITTLSITESLYLVALISYPRTSSQKLPPSIGYKQILEQLSINYVEKYENTLKDVLKRKNLIPYQGNEVDPAHPAIYPTGLKQSKLNVLQQRILDLIIKRFLSTFGNSIALKYSEVSINVNGHQFIAKGSTILNDGWSPIYDPYYSINESSLPELTNGESVKLSEVTVRQDFTRPPAKYNQASLLDKMEFEGIGTKSTRAEIINLLLKRKYITQDKIGIEATEVGFTILNTMKKFVPEIVSTKLTNILESSIKRIEKGELNMKVVRKYLEKSLNSPLKKIKTNERAIGIEMRNALINSDRRVTIGKCPKCRIGEMVIIRSSKSNKRFIACSQYRVTGCNAIASVPQYGFIKKSNAICSCGWPILRIMFVKNKLLSSCVNRFCSKNKYKKFDS